MTRGVHKIGCWRRSGSYSQVILGTVSQGIVGLERIIDLARGANENHWFSRVRRSGVCQ